MNPPLCIAGIDMGGTRIKAVLHHATKGEEIDRTIQPTGDDGDPSDVTPPWAVAIEELIESWEKEHGVIIEAVGIACPGLVRSDGRSIEHLPGKLEGLVDFNFSDFLGRHCRMINDAHAALLGEVENGVARGKDDVVMLTLGTGVGGAILSNGQLLRGRIGRAGHCGHMCLDAWSENSGVTGTPGSLEIAIGNYTVEERSKGRFPSTLDLIHAVQDNDTEAKAIWNRSVEALACGVTSLINILDPEAVVIGGGIAEVGDLLFEPLKAHLNRIEWRPGGHAVEILHASLGEWSGALGALANIKKPKH